MRVIILTSTFLRHHYVVNYVAEQLEVVGVLQEEKSFRPERYAANTDDLAVIAKHFEDRDKSEAECFADHRTLALELGAQLRAGSPGIVNDPNELEEMSALSPDVVLVFGAGLLGGSIIERFLGRIINLHLGLSPYYRGAGTNFWPLVNREPEFVGATVHCLDAGIDTGPLIAHARPEIYASDGPHDIGNKAIVAGAAALVRAARAYAADDLNPALQINKGHLYQRKDFSADAVRTLWRNFESGMITEYLVNKAERDAKINLLGSPAVA